MKRGLLMLDLDGTIADTIGSIRDAVNLALKKNGYADRSYDQVRMAIGSGARMLIDRSIRIEDSAVDTETITRVYADYESFYDVTYDHVDGCYEGMSEAMHALHDRGYTLAVLSNKQDSYVKKIVELLFPDGIVAHAQGQTELPVKPDPAAPLAIAARLGFDPSETVFIGDSDVDIYTGQNAGMKTVGCAWGYRGRTVLEASGADYVIDRASELLTLFT